METMTFEELFKLIKEQNELIEKLASKVESLEHEVTKNSSPWLRGWKGVSDYTSISIPTLMKVPELSESLTPFKLTGTTFLFKKEEIDEFLEGTAVRG